MLIALLALLGVNLAALLAVAAVVLTRKRWVKRQPGAFRGAIRVADGEIDGLHPKWRRGYGRWVRDILVWTKGPFLFRNDLVVADDLQEHRPALPGEVKRLGDHPTLIRVRAGKAAIELAAHGHDAELLVGPYRKVLGTTGVAPSVPTGPAGERP
jgi:hypothetical protein